MIIRHFSAFKQLRLKVFTEFLFNILAQISIPQAIFGLLRTERNDCVDHCAIIEL